MYEQQNTANDYMKTFDKILGAFLFLVALPAAIQADVHWSAISLLVVACLVFAGFIVQAKRERCRRCGHYYSLNAYEVYIDKTKTQRCSSCAPAAEQPTQDPSTI